VVVLAPRGDGSAQVANALIPSREGY
jgi:hypothetical protein